MKPAVTLIPVEQQGKSESEEEWISPIGHTIDDLIAEHGEENPKFKKEDERERPRRELASLMMIRRAELNISQQELADRMGTSVSVISRLERSRQDLSLATLQRLATALDTKLVCSFEPNQAGALTRVVVP
jgi:ribosome-binding protein aMBF1 (putative translation factor)